MPKRKLTNQLTLQTKKYYNQIKHKQWKTMKKLPDTKV